MSATSHRILSGLMFVALQNQQGTRKFRNNFWLQQDNMTTSKKWICKEVADQLMTTSVVKHSIKMLNHIFENNSYLCLDTDHQILPHPSEFTSLLFSLISTTFTVMEFTTPILVLLHFPFFLFFVIVPSGTMMV